jgi:hypothetical protein
VLANIPPERLPPFTSQEKAAAAEVFGIPFKEPLVALPVETIRIRAKEVEAKMNAAGFFLIYDPMDLAQGPGKPAGTGTDPFVEFEERVEEHSREEIANAERASLKAKLFMMVLPSISQKFVMPGESGEWGGDDADIIMAERIAVRARHVADKALSAIEEIARDYGIDPESAAGLVQ